MITATNQTLLSSCRISRIPRSVSLIECGAVHTDFDKKLLGGRGGALERVDAQTRHFFAHYQRVYERALSEAQDPEEVTEVGATGPPRKQSSGRVGQCTPKAPHERTRFFSPQLFLTALRAPRPALRYFSTDRFLPLVRLRTEDPRGSSYVSAMHHEAFADLPAQEGTEAGAGDPNLVSSALTCLPGCATPRVASELCWPAADELGQDKTYY